MMEYHTNHVKIHLIKILDLDVDVRELIQEITHNSSSKTKLETGKIPKQEQYTDQIFKRPYQFKVEFITALNCNLNLSSRFRERAKIVKSWSRRIAPGSIWEFNLTHNLGRGIHINRLCDIQSRFENFQEMKTNTNKFLETLEMYEDIRLMLGTEKKVFKKNLKESKKRISTKKSNTQRVISFVWNTLETVAQMF